MPPKRPYAPEDLRRIRLVRKLSRLLDGPMAVLSLLFFGLVIADLALGPHAPEREWLDHGILALWGVFWLEFLLKFTIAPDKEAFLKGRWFDLAFLVFPMLRLLLPLRAVHAIRGTYSLVKLGLAVRRGTRVLGRFGRQSRIGYVAGLTSLVVLGGATLMLLFERDAPHSEIQTFGDALWWSAALVTTVASGLNPVTPAGRVLAVAMMVYGMGVFGYFVTQAVAFLQRSPR